MKTLLVHGHRDPDSGEISRTCHRRVYAAERIADAGAVIFSGAGLAGHDPEALQMDALWNRRLGVHGIVEPYSRTTRENAEQALRIVRRLGARRVLLITSREHLPRALWYAARAGLPVDRLGSWRACARWEWRHLGHELASWARIALRRDA